VVEAQFLSLDFKTEIQFRIRMGTLNY
jgi:hypothetical protein